MGNRIFNMGPIRPPSEANSLLLRVTEGCTWNKCKFCRVYRGTNFKVYQVEDIKRDIDIMAEYRDRIMTHLKANGRVNRMAIVDEIRGLPTDEQNCFYLMYNWLANGGKSVFLQDGNSIALKPEKLAEVLNYLREKFPHIERITTYGRAETAARWSVEQLTLLRESGLDRIHTGFESGSDAVLSMIDKGLTQAQEIDAGKKIKAAGMELSVYFMPGIGGIKYSKENAEETAYVVSQINPDFVRMRTFAVKDGTEMWADYLSGAFEECDDIQKLQEIRTFIQQTENCSGTLVSDHIINLIGDLGGRMDYDKGAMLQRIDNFLSWPEEEQKLYQLIRRLGFLEAPEQMAQISESQRNQYLKQVRSITDKKQWDRAMNQLLRNYI